MRSATGATEPSAEAGFWDALKPDGATPVGLPALLTLARHLPLPTPDEIAARLEVELGVDSWQDAAIFELLCKAPAPVARARLRRLADDERAPFTATSFAALASVRGAREDLVGAARLLEESLRPEPDRATAARRAFDATIRRELAAGRELAVSAFEIDLARRFPGLVWLGLDAAAAAGLAGQHAEGEALFAELAEQTRDGCATEAIVAHGQAELGRAWLAWLRGAPRAEVEAHVAAARALPRTPLRNEDAVHVLLLRAELVAGYVRAAFGEDPAPTFAAALAAAPLDTDRCFVDEAWFGPLGPTFALEVKAVRRDRRGAALASASRALVEVIEADAPRSGHGLAAAVPEDDEHEHLASWIFLRAAERWVEDGGDAQAALALLAPRISALERRRLWPNLELLFETRLLEARCQLALGDADAALAATDAALGAARGLTTSARSDFVERIARDDAPPPPPGVLMAHPRPPYAHAVVRARLTRGNVLATLRGDVAAAAEELFAVHPELPWDDDHWLRCALDFARRGHAELARRCLRCVEPSSDHAYDLACVHAQLGTERDRNEAVVRLREHLDQHTFTAPGRALELAAMTRDHDLEPVRSHPNFPE